MQRPQLTTSPRRASRVVLLGSLALALAGCADLGFPTEPSYSFDDAGGGGCSAGRATGTVRASIAVSREEGREERTRACAVTRGGAARQPARK
jgi:hypothetical protein